MSRGDLLKQKREQLGLTQTDVAAAIGVSKQTLYKYENNIVTNIPSDKIERLAKVLHTTPSDLMGWDAKPVASSLSSSGDDIRRRLIELKMMQDELDDVSSIKISLESNNSDLVDRIYRQLSRFNSLSNNDKLMLDNILQRFVDPDVSRRKQ